MRARLKVTLRNSSSVHEEIFADYLVYDPLDGSLVFEDEDRETLELTVTRRIPLKGLGGLGARKLVIEADW